MKITKDNYFEHVKRIGFEKLPLVLKQSHMVIMTKTDNGEDWKLYNSDKDLKRMVDLAFEKLKEYIESQFKSEKGVDGLDGQHLTPRDVAINLIKPHVLRGDTIELHPANRLSVKEQDFAAHIEGEQVIVTMLYGTDISEVFLVQDLIDDIIFEKKRSHTVAPGKPRKKRETYKHKQPEFRFLKAILHWHNMKVTKGMVNHFADEVKKALHDGEVNNTSPVFKEIQSLEVKLLKLRKEMSDTITVRLSEESRKKFKEALKKVTDTAKQSNTGKGSSGGSADYKGAGLAGKEKAVQYKCEHKYIKLILELEGKVLTRKELDKIIEDLQVDIERRRITKDSPFKFEINFIQDELVRAYNNMKGNTTDILLRDGIRSQLKQRLVKTREYKKSKAPQELPKKQRNISLKGLLGPEQDNSEPNERQAHRFLTSLFEWQDIEVNKGMIDFFIWVIGDWQAIEFSKKSVVWSEIEYARKTLEQFRKRMSDQVYFDLSPESKEIFKKALDKLAKSGATLDGVNSRDLTVAGKQNTGKTEPVKLINSADFANMNFETIGFTGKWLAFIGNPSPGFKAAVSGMPKMGKTYLCIDFANYLSQNHGRVLYVSKEEYMSPTLQLKLKEKNVGNENLDVSGTLPPDLSAYKFIFLDSVSSLKLSADDLTKLEAANPGKSFIYVFQVTKAGKARGTNEFMHNVDIIIDVPEKGKAMQYGRYNQGGEMDIFSNNDTTSPANLKPLLPESAPALAGLDGRGSSESKKSKSEQLFEDIKSAIKKLEKVNASIYKTKNANWGEVASLCLIHTNLGERLDDSYEGARGYSKSLEEGLNRHYNANIKLLKEALVKMTGYAKKNYYAEMSDWCDFLEEEVNRFGFELNKIEEQSKKRKEGRKIYGKPVEAMTIKTEFSVPLEILAGLLFTKPMEEMLLEKIDDKPEEVEEAAKGLAEDEIKENKVAVKVLSVKYVESDSDNLSHGVAYFTVELEGKKADLRQITGRDELFYYQW